MELKILVPLALVPEGTSVVKKGGTYEYTVRDNIPVYGGGQETGYGLKAEEGCRFLVCKQSANINATPSDKEVVWLTTLEELNELFTEEEDK